MKNKISAATTGAFSFVILMGIVSLFSDMTHEGAASVLGAFLSLAGASAAAIGFFSGLGELIGYSLRLVSGILADKTKMYWPITIIGYVIDIAAVPALAFVPRGGWQLACILILIRRVGKAIKKPAKDTILSFAATQLGAGKSFAIQELLDQIGAFLGPVLLFAVLAIKKNGDTFAAYSHAFLLLGIPAFITIALLIIARIKFPTPENFEKDSKETSDKFVLKKNFILYIIAISLFAFGFVDFPVIEMHVAKLNLISADTLPLLYALAMIIDAFAALIFGTLYDRFGIPTLAVSTLISAAFPILIFSAKGVPLLIAGTACWGVGMGAQESILKSVVTTIMPKNMRSTGFGIFETTFGIFWFLGSWITGILYDMNMTWLIITSTTMQLAAIPLYLATAGANKNQLQNQLQNKN